jgi:hypothetical protein
MRPTFLVPLGIYLLLCTVPLAIGACLMISPRRTANFLSDAFIIFPHVEAQDTAKRWFYRLLGAGIVAVSPPSRPSLRLPCHAVDSRAVFVSELRRYPAARIAVLFRPMTKASTLYEYARMGATARITELQAEIAHIRKLFPKLDGMAAKSPGRSKASVSPALAKLMDPKPKRRKLSAAARKAISDAQKRRWAALKAKE